MSAPKHPASRLRHRVTLEQPVETPDGAGGITRSWEEVAQLWAEIIPAQPQASERLRGEKLEARASYRVSLRTGVEITAQMRLVLEERIFEITGVTLPVDAREPVRLAVVEE